MGGFNLPMFVFFLLMAVVVATPFLIWSDLSTWLILLVAPIVSYLSIFSLSLILDLVERRVEEPDFEPIPEAGEADFSLPKKPKGLCLVHDEAPQWVCNACGHKFGKLGTAEGA
ncbi:MAG: hypothetical protein JRF69_10615 [Deltaproteobacteria bacterium]|nr:hypothetical protein [Deltaproteobacteria bacterium]